MKQDLTKLQEEKAERESSFIELKNLVAIKLSYKENPSTIF